MTTRPVRTSRTFESVFLNSGEITFLISMEPLQKQPVWWNVKILKVPERPSRLPECQPDLRVMSTHMAFPGSPSFSRNTPQEEPDTMASPPIATILHRSLPHRKRHETDSTLRERDYTVAHRCTRSCWASRTGGLATILWGTCISERKQQ